MLYICQIIVFIEIIVDQLRLGWLCCTYQIIVCIEIIVCSQSVEIGLAMLSHQLRLGRLCCIYVFIEIIDHSLYCQIIFIEIHSQSVEIGQLCCTYARS